MKTIKILTVAVLAFATAGCEQRDLYSTSVTITDIDSKWQKSLDQPEMRSGTVLLYKDGKMITEHFSRANGTSVITSNGHYDVLMINGIMESGGRTDLDHVSFRGHDSIHTFEACIVESSTPKSRFTRGENEYIASNNMELLAFEDGHFDVNGEETHYMKYDNGKKILDLVDHITYSKIEYEPRLVSYRFRVKLNNIVNPRSAMSALGALRGFAGSVFLVTQHKKPEHGFVVTHHLNMNTAGPVSKNGEAQETGALQSQEFVSFGPCIHEFLDSDEHAEHDGTYEFEPLIVLNDESGSEYRHPPIDITPQVNKIIEQIHAHHHDAANTISNEENIFVRQKVSSAAAGRTYRLRVAVEGFDAVESTVVAPAALTLAECSIDTSRWIAKNRTWTADYGGGFGGYSGLFDDYRYHPAKIGIVDLTTDKCYYAIELFYSVKETLGRPREGGLMYVATNNQLLVQDNPYIEDDGILSDGDAPEAFAFRQMVISNLLFTNKICKEEFLLSAIYDTKKEDLMNVDSTGDFPSIGYTEDQIEEVEVVATIKLRRLTTEQFQYYRTGILQGWSGGDIALFMEEPVSVPRNIANGYGNFSVSTAVQQELYRRRVWRVKQQQYY